MSKCKECPWVIKNKHNESFINHSKRLSKSHNCHMLTTKVWDTNDKQKCKGRIEHERSIRTNK